MERIIGSGKRITNPEHVCRLPACRMLHFRPADPPGTSEARRTEQGILRSTLRNASAVTQDRIPGDPALGRDIGWLRTVVAVS